MVAAARRVKSSVEQFNSQLTVGASELGVSQEAAKEVVPLYARPVNEKNTLKVIDRRSKREKFKALVLDSKRSLLQKKDTMLDDQ